MQAQPFGGSRDIALAGLERGLNVFPFRALKRGRFTGRVGIGHHLRLTEGGNDVIHFGRLGEVMTGAKLDGVYRSRNAGVARKHYDSKLRFATQQRGNQTQTTVLGEA